MFTRNQIDEIKRKLSLVGAKDSSFPQASALSGSEDVAMVQQGKNVKVAVKELMRAMSVWTTADLLNLSKDTEDSYTIEEAITLVPQCSRKAGQIITFLDSTTGSWSLYQFKGESSSEWLNMEYWDNVLAQSPDHFKGWFINETILYSRYSRPQIGDYAFVGDTLDTAVLYGCIKYGEWYNTKQPATSYADKFDAVYSKDFNEFAARLDETYADRATKDALGNVIHDTYAKYNDIGNAVEQEVREEISNIQIQDGSITWDKLAPSTRSMIATRGKVTNLADDEDLTTVGDTIKFADKEYNENVFSGYGRVYLRQNMLSGVNVLEQYQLPTENTRYIVQYEYSLNNSTVTVPSNCILDFTAGGWFKNGTLVCNNTLIIIPRKSDLTVALAGSYSFWGGDGGSTVNVVDNLESTSVTTALSANQGRVLNDKFAPYDEAIAEIKNAQSTINYDMELVKADVRDNKDNLEGTNNQVADLYNITDALAVTGNTAVQKAETAYTTASNVATQVSALFGSLTSLDTGVTELEGRVTDVEDTTDNMVSRIEKLEAGGGTIILDTLTSGSTVAALSANMGKTLKELIDTNESAFNEFSNLTGERLGNLEDKTSDVPTQISSLQKTTAEHTAQIASLQGSTFSVINHLGSSSTTDALSANMGRELDDKISEAYDMATKNTSDIATINDSVVPDLRMGIKGNSDQITFLAEDYNKLAEKVNNIVVAGDTEIIDALTSTSTTAALSANQGYVLGNKTSTLEESIKTLSYNLTSRITALENSKVSVINSLTSTDTANALSAYQGKVLSDELDGVTVTVGSLQSDMTTLTDTTVPDLKLGIKGNSDQIEGLYNITTGHTTKITGLESRVTDLENTGLSEIEVIDNVESSSTTAALSANMGKELSTSIASTSYDLSLIDNRVAALEEAVQALQK